ncbi:DUF7344 domain-containing protein [Halorarum halophilum]
MAELARGIAAAETGAPPLEVPPNAYETAYVSVYQSHMPVLDASPADIVYSANPLPERRRFGGRSDVRTTSFKTHPRLRVSCSLSGYL